MKLCSVLILLVLLFTGCASLRSDPKDTEEGIIDRAMLAEFYSFPGISTWTRVVATPLFVLDAPVTLPGWGLVAWGNHDKIGQTINNGWTYALRYPVEGTTVAILFLLTD